MTAPSKQVLRCLDCGKCTGVCPVARYNNSLSPRRLMRRLAEGRDNGGHLGLPDLHAV